MHACVRMYVRTYVCITFILVWPTCRIPAVSGLIVCEFGGDPIKFQKRLKKLICHFVFQNMRSAGYHEKMIGRTYFGSDQVTQLNLVLYNTIKWPYQPKHSPSFRLHHTKQHSYTVLGSIDIL